jgi:hypothetical protein
LKSIKFLIGFLFLCGLILPYQNCGRVNFKSLEGGGHGLPHPGAQTHLYFQSYTNDLNIEICPAKLLATNSEGTLFEYELSSEPLKLSQKGTPMETIGIEAGSYQKVQVVLEPKCAAHSLSLTNGNGFFESSNNISLTFTGEITVSHNRSLVLELQPLIDELNTVGNSTEILVKSEAVIGKAFVDDPLNPTGSPVGGGAGYKFMVGTPTQTVTDRVGLLAALAGAVSGDIIYVDDGAQIDLTGLVAIAIPGGVTLASGRGRNGSSGALIFTTDFTQDLLPLFRVANPGVRITGLRLQGPDSEIRQSTGSYGTPNSHAIQITADDVEIDNNKIWAFSHTGIAVYTGGTAHIHHNDISYTRRWGLGYSIVVKEAKVLVEANILDWGRKAVSTTNHPGCELEMRYNQVGENFYGFPVSINGTGGLACGPFNIHHNAIKTTTEFALIGSSLGRVSVFGIPPTMSHIKYNDFAPAKANAINQKINQILQSETFTNIEVEQNRYDVSF